MSDPQPRRIAGLGVTEIVAGLFCIAVGLGAMWVALGYDMGSARRMGPGYFPFALGLLLCLFGLGIALVEGRLVAVRPAGKPALRSLAAIMVAILAFALLVQPAGLVAAVFAATFLSTLAEREVRLLPSLLVAAGVTVLAVGIFHVGLDLPIRLWGK